MERHIQDTRILAVDMDRTLLRSDPRHEGFWAALGANARATLRAGNPAGWDEIYPLRTDLLPVNSALLGRLKGRRVVLITRAAPGVAERLRDHLCPGARVLPAKGAGDALQDTPFDLIAGPLTPPALRQAAQHVETAPEAPLIPAIWRLMRPHHWAKNLLLLLPLLAMPGTATPSVGAILLAVLGFCAGASAIYGLNDLLDLEADRGHPTKRKRPIASGAIPAGTALHLSVALGAFALLMGGLIGPAVLGLIAFYMCLSLTYSLHLKALAWVDLAALVTLYLLRVAAGAVTTGVSLSGWLWAGVAAMFLTLAVVKRLTGLARLPHRSHLPGRGYGDRDLTALYRLGLAGACMTALAVLGWSLAPEVTIRFTQPRMLLPVAPLLTLWLWRMVHLARAGKEDFDPLVFVARDRAGLAILATCTGFYAAAL